MVKYKNNKKFWQATAMMVGYVIGVGMFGLPYIVMRAGVLPFIAIIMLLAPIQYLLHLIYGNLILATKTFHRMPGYSEIYLGKPGKIAVFIAKLIGNYGALLAYIIITGKFLNDLLAPYFFNNEFIYASLLFFLEIFVIFFGIRAIAKAELFITTILIFAVCLIAFKGFPAIEGVNYTVLNWKYMLLPYGALLFSLNGNGSLPIVAKLLKRDKEKMKKVIRIGSFVPLLIIILFTFVIVGISGPSTTDDALTGVKVVLDDGVILFSLIFGVLTMTTSFLGVAESIRETLWWDFKMKKLLAWALAVFVPYFAYIFLFVSGKANLSDVISFTGGMAGSLSGIMLMLIFIKLRKRKNKLPLFKYKLPAFVPYLLMAIFISGMVFEIYQPFF